MLDPQLYQGRVSSAAEISLVPTHGDPGPADDLDPADPSDKLGKILNVAAKDLTQKLVPRKSTAKKPPESTPH